MNKSRVSHLPRIMPMSCIGRIKHIDNNSQRQHSMICENNHPDNDTQSGLRAINGDTT